MVSTPLDGEETLAESSSLGTPQVLGRAFDGVASSATIATAIDIGAIEGRCAAVRSRELLGLLGRWGRRPWQRGAEDG